MTELPKNLDTILHIGAGRGEELPAYLESDAKRILLVEPNPNLAEQLRRRAQSDERVQVLELAITDDPALDQLNEYNLPEAASLYRPTGLRQIFPGLRVTAQHAVATQTPEQLLEQYPLVGDHNLLVIQAPGAESAIVNALSNANKLGNISHIQATLPAEVYYEGSQGAEDTLHTLIRRGYDTEHTDTENPDWPEYHLECNPLARRLQDVDLEKQSLMQALQQRKKEQEYTQSILGIAKQELADARQELDHKQQDWQTQKLELIGSLEEAQRTEKAVKNEKNKLAERHQQVEEKLLKYKKSLSNRKQELKNKYDDLEKQNSLSITLEQENARLKVKVQQLEKQLSADTKGQKQFAGLKRHMEHLFEQQGLQLEQATNALGRHVSASTKSTVRELEASLQFQQQYGGRLPSLEERGRQISSPFALRLVRQLQSSPYDLVIEMGGGVSTTFIANALRNEPFIRSSDRGRNAKEVIHQVEASEGDLPKRIVCFEHSRSKCSSLQKDINEKGLSPLVSLYYTPLVPHHFQGEDALFYDCSAYLQQIAKLLESREARIFVHICFSQETPAPCLFAALPQVLQYVSHHSIDLVVETQAGMSVLHRWYDLMNERGIEYTAARNFGDEQAILLTINP